MFSLKLSFFWAKIPQMLPVEQEWLPPKNKPKDVSPTARNKNSYQTRNGWSMFIAQPFLL